jgi:AcrR family transcriptional regulator
LQSPGELSIPGVAPPGLRERKKARTRGATPRPALPVFRGQGYDEKKVSQIAEAAEVSESTFFRYFPSKEDVVLWDDFDPRVIQLFRSQPHEMRPVEGLRVAIREVLGELTHEQQLELRERMDLMLAVPELRTNMLEQMEAPMRLFAEMLAERSGRRPDDPAVRALAGAIMGVSMATMFAFAQDPNADMVEMLDEALGYLDAGLPL